MRITSCSNSCKRMFRHHPSATPIVGAYNSASAELKLTACCVRDHAVSVAFRHCTTPPLVLLHVVACSAQLMSVYTFTNFDVMISIRLLALGAPFTYLTVRFRFISSLSVGHVIFLAVSFRLYMTSARSWHKYNSFPTTVLHIVFRLPVQRVILSLASSSHLESSRVCFFQTKNIYHVSNVLRTRFHQVSSCRSLKSLCPEIDFVTCLLHSSCDPHQNLF